MERRAQKQLTLRVRRSTANSTKTMETFDFAFNPAINRQQVLQLASCDFIRQQRNILICGPTETGKTHLAQAFVHEACRQGFDALFTSVTKMLQHLHGGRADDPWYTLADDLWYSDRRHLTGQWASNDDSTRQTSSFRSPWKRRGAPRP